MKNLSSAVITVLVLAATAFGQQSKPRTKVDYDALAKANGAIPAPKVKWDNPAAICARDMHDVFGKQLEFEDDSGNTSSLNLPAGATLVSQGQPKLPPGGDYFFDMSQSALKQLAGHASDCLSLVRDLRGLRETAMVLAATVYRQGFNAGVDLASSASQRNLASEREKSVADYNALAHAYNSLSDRYEGLLNLASNLASRPSVIQAPSQPAVIKVMPPPPPEPHFFHCVATALPGNSAAINCQ
jgi:hypothetical protein